jgi:hypothetical protein
MIEYGHFAEEIARAHSGKTMPLFRSDGRGNLNFTRLDDIHAIAGIALLEDLVARRKASLLRCREQRLQLGCGQLMK